MDKMKLDTAYFLSFCIEQYKKYKSGLICELQKITTEK